MSKANFVQSVLNTKKRAEKGLQAVGGQIRHNVAEGQRKDFNYQTRINPLAGAKAAFLRGYGS